MSNKREIKDLIQTKITPFLRYPLKETIRNDLFENLNSLSIKKLQKIARAHRQLV